MPKIHKQQHEQRQSNKVNKNRTQDRTTAQNYSRIAPKANNLDLFPLGSLQKTAKSQIKSFSGFFFPKKSQTKSSVTNENCLHNNSKKER